MSRFEQQLERDLGQIADRATPSPDAWDSILTRIADQDPIHETEIIMLTDNTIRTKRWPLFAAAAAVVALLVGGLALINRDDGEQQPADTPAPPELEIVPPQPDDVETDDPTAPETADEVVPDAQEQENDQTPPAAEQDTADPVFVGEATSTYDGVRTIGEPREDGTRPVSGTWTLDGDLTGEVTLTGSNFSVPPNGDLGGTTDYVFTGTVDGLGTGTLTFSDEWVTDLRNGGVATTITVTGGTGDLEGATGSAELSDRQITYEGSDELITGTITFTIVMPPSG